MLTGPSGSGKSLFLRAIADLDPVDEGRVFCRDRDAATVPACEWRSRVIYLHQAGVVAPGTVAQNIDLIASLKIYGGRLEPTPVAGLAPNADAERLSGGERQRLAIHRALMCDPDVLLLDESTSAMDPATRDVWEQRIRDWVDQGHAALWISHDAELPRRLGARVESFP